MSDDDITANDDREELLRAYVDGELDAVRRAEVEASPELMAEATELEALRAALAAHSPVDGDRREVHLAAALAEFDALHTTDVPATDAAGAPEITAPPPPSNVTALRPRRWNWSHSLAAAAAVVLVVFGGVLVLRDDADAPTAGDNQIAPTALNDDLVERSDEPANADGDLGGADGAADEEVAEAPTADDAVEPGAVADDDAEQPPAPRPVQPIPAGAPDIAEQSTVATQLLETADEFTEFATTIDDPPSESAVAERCADDEAIEPDARVRIDDEEYDVVVVTPTDGGDDEFAPYDIDGCELLEWPSSA